MRSQVGLPLQSAVPGLGLAVQRLRPVFAGQFDEPQRLSDRLRWMCFVGRFEGDIKSARGILIWNLLVVCHSHDSRCGSVHRHQVVEWHPP